MFLPHTDILGIVAVVDIAIQERPVRARDIAARLNLRARYLESMLQDLVGLVPRYANCQIQLG
jgi:hypothetical protein